MVLWYEVSSSFKAVTGFQIYHRDKAVDSLERSSDTFVLFNASRFARLKMFWASFVLQI